VKTREALVGGWGEKGEKQLDKCELFTSVASLTGNVSSRSITNIRIPVRERERNDKTVSPNIEYNGCHGSDRWK